MLDLKPFKASLVENTRDWSSDLQPTIDLIAAADGDESDISDIDLLQAKAMAKAGNIPTDSRTGLFLDGFDKIEDLFVAASYVELEKRHFGDDSPIYKMFRYDVKTNHTNSAMAALQVMEQMLYVMKLHQKDETMSPYEKMYVLGQLLKALDFEVFKDASDNSFADNILKNSYNCFVYSFIGYVVGRELGWPVHVVLSRNHVFLRWDDGNARFNFDQGAFFSDEHYKKQFQIFPEQSIYLKNLTEMQVSILITYNQALLYGKGGDSKTALNNLADVVEHLGNMPELFHAMSNIAEENRNHKDAIDFARTAFKLDPTAPGGSFKLGVLYLSEPRNDSLAAYYMFRAVQACEFNVPVDGERLCSLASAALGKIYAGRDEDDKSIKYLEKAMQYDSSDADTWYDLAVMYRINGQWERALDSARMASELDATNEKYAEFYAKVKGDGESFWGSIKGMFAGL